VGGHPASLGVGSHPKEIFGVAETTPSGFRGGFGHP
jgi:hypothetical protein